MGVFDKYSTYYDLLYRDKDYAGEVAYIQRLIKKYAPNAVSILDLGCGTGRHDFHFSELGYQVDGVDFSPLMVNIANQKCTSTYKTQANNLTFSIGDIRSFRNYRKYDVVVSLFHVMSYQTSNEDLHAAFETAKAHLKPNGIFIFDFWYGPGVLADPPVVRVKRFEDKYIHITRIAEPIMHPNENCVDVNYTIFIKNRANGSVDEIKESHKMRYLFLPEVRGIAQGKRKMWLEGKEWLKEESLSARSWNGVVVLKNE